MTVRALTVEPGVPDSVRLDDLADDGGDGGVELAAGDGAYEVETLLVGVCGTDREIVAGAYGTAPEGSSRLVLGHEAVGRVTRAPDGAPLAAGDLVVPIVRRPDPVPCGSCAVGEWDMCRNGLYTEHGITGAHGFARERLGLEPGFAVAVPASLGDLAVLVEPASVVGKGWEQIERIGARAHWEPQRVLVTGAGPIGLLAALMARQRGLETYVLDRITDGPKPDLVADLGATYRTGSVQDACPPPDIVLECTGVGSLVLEVMEHTAPAGIVCLAGISSGHRSIELAAAELNRRMVLENDVVFGTVNANRRHYELAVESLAAADRSWLERLVTRRVPLDAWPHAFSSDRDGTADVKTVLDVAALASK
jgi:threonine dehydrogenase-like Zn-dependent dehydrogenase